ncbi:MAG: ribonuclease HII [Candidatus Bathyarchaeaceae archaeon]
MKVAGVDDAGRGSIIGPLAIAGVLLDNKDLTRLMDLGVKDSKRLSPRRREQLAAEIKEIALKYHIEMLSPAEIDRVVETGRKLHKLNRLEAQTMAKVITILKPEVAYVDASDVLADRFKQHIMENLPFKVQVISEHKADVKYPIVSAASILAKVERDKVISRLREKHGNIGCGYATDPNTIKFLEDWIRKFGSYPDFVRRSWKPAKKLKTKAEKKQTKLV